MQLDDEVPLSGETVTVACDQPACWNRNVRFDVAVEMAAICGPCGSTLYQPAA